MREEEGIGKAEQGMADYYYSLNTLLLIKAVSGRLSFPLPPPRIVFLIPPSPQIPFPRASHA
jgi:hypothetical protein